MAKLMIIGPAWPYRGGGITSFNQRLARAFQDAGHDCSILSFTYQYPGFLFPGKSQYGNDPKPDNLRIVRAINSVNPFNWLRVGNRVSKEKPDLIIVRFWLPFMGPAFGTILRRVKKNGHTRIVCIADNVIPHEKRPGDLPFTRYFLKVCDAFITMSEHVMGDLKKFVPEKPAIYVPHPLYDNFGDPVPKSAAREKLQIPSGIPVFLFFGFIRKYKGLDLLLQAVAILKKSNTDFRLLVAGEFYGDEKNYEQQILELDIADKLILRTSFIPDNEIRYYLSAADCVVQPYRHATQSGVTPLAYHFSVPMIVTNVGGLPALVPDNVSGIVVEPNPEAIAAGMRLFLETDPQSFQTGIETMRKKLSWSTLTESILQLAQLPPTNSAS